MILPMKMPYLSPFAEFVPYFVIGLIATAIDWTLFWFAINKIHLHYEIALIFGFVTAGIFHFTTNKTITFKCQSKQLRSQYSVYTLVTLATLVISMGIIALMINIFMINKMLSRVLTTGLLLIPNFLLHKYITFNKKLFIQHERHD